MLLAAAHRVPATHRVPIIDVALVALVLLIIAAPLLRRLPSMATPAIATAQEVRLQVASGGGYLLDGRPVSQADLTAALRRAQATAPDLRLRIATADDSDSSALVGALAVAERAGVRNIGSETR